MKIHTHKKAFSLLELIFVIVILGIVSSIGSTIIAQVYENYITQRALHRVSLKTELAINQIVNRLTYRIGSSTIARNPTDNSFIEPSSINYNTSNKDKSILEWIGYDEDSFSARTRPSWSGYCDLNTTRTTNTRMRTEGSSLSKTRTIVQNLAGDTTDRQLALLFNLGGNGFNASIFDPGPQCYGYDNNTSCIHQVTVRNNSTFNIALPAGTNITDHYKLAWSAYALVPVDRNGNVISAANDTRLFDLELRSDYQPWAGTQYNTATTDKSIILRNVTAFKFSSQGGTIRIKLCATEDIGLTANISVCKEKAVIR